MTKMLIKPVAQQSVEGQTLNSLREFILSGALAPGTRLTEVALAESIGVARATLRTGLARLADEGLVVRTPYSGWHVAELTADDVRELWTLRGGLESVAARIVAEQSDPDARQLITDAYQDLLDACESGDVERMSESDFRFHVAVIDATGHSRLKRHYDLVAQQVRLYIRTSNASVATGPQDILDQHAPIYESLMTGSPAEAAHHAWLHNASEGQRLLDWMANQQEDTTADGRKAP
ncbi:GntR family transcriptional regulator (plasmid) [Arthrobacter sp. UC242_113]|uniref:GntR family transcriptional regulator n=1 Tax=Arthrobacter sp. UC242_113 TaxID=3374550 RepID=UPI0037574762